MAISKKKRIRRKLGDVVAVPLGGTYGYGRVLKEPLMAFYNLHSNDILAVENILPAPVAFRIWVINYAVTHGIWPVLGHSPLTPELLEEPLFFKKDSISRELTIYRDSTSEEMPATREQCEKLECGAVWEPHHVVGRQKEDKRGRKKTKGVGSLCY